MAQVTKTDFTPAEAEAISSSEFFYIKHTAIKKVTELFSELERELRKNIHQYPFLKGHTDIATGRVFKGENYRQLPYVVLDYPKRFSADCIFTFRSMFWWGNEFSFTLHLGGHSLEHFGNHLWQNIISLKGKDFFICTNHKQWEYHFGEDNYRPLDEILKETSEMEKIQSKSFIKLSRKIPVTDYENLIPYGVQTFDLLISATNY